MGVKVTKVFVIKARAPLVQHLRYFSWYLVSEVPWIEFFE